MYVRYQFYFSALDKNAGEKSQNIGNKEVWSIIISIEIPYVRINERYSDIGDFNNVSALFYCRLKDII